MFRLSASPAVCALGSLLDRFFVCVRCRRFLTGHSDSGVLQEEGGEIIALFRKLAAEGMHLIISSHILHEVDMMSDFVVLLNNGYVVAEGNIHGVRDEMEEHPMQILIRCDHPGKLAAKVFAQDHVVEARLHEDLGGLFIRTRRADEFYLLLNRIVAEGEVIIESIAPVDDDLNAVYQYLIGSEGGSA